MSKAPLEVIKVGGSLVTRDDFAPALRNWLAVHSAERPGRRRVLLVGGGPLVDALRGLDAVQRMPAAFSHWLAIDLMETTGRIVANLLPELEVTSDYQLIGESSSPGATWLLLATQFLHDAEPHLPGERLPWGWHVTSDSIAARLAAVLEADRLTLLKSSPPPGSGTHDGWRRAAAAGWVDAFFPLAAAEVKSVCWANLPVTTVASSEGNS